MAPEFADYCYLTGFAIGCAIRRVYARRRTGGPVATGRRTAADVVAVGGGALGMFVLPLVYLATDRLRAADYSLPPTVAPAFTALGSAAFALALWLLWRSHRDLGRAWSVFPQVHLGQELVTLGVYSRIRHPMYAAQLLWALAQALLLRNWIAGPAMLLAMVPFYLVRVRQEEGLLREHFGEQYEAYAGRTGRIVPRRRRPG